MDDRECKKLELPKWICHWVATACAAQVPGMLLIKSSAWALSFSVAFVLALIGREFAAGYVKGYLRAQRLVEVKYLTTVAGEVEAEPSEWMEVPAAPPGSGYLYVIQFGTDVVKVGQTNNAARRIGEHKRAAAAFGVAIRGVWVSAAHPDYLVNEVSLIGFASTLGPRSRREYFHGADFEKIREFGLSLVAQA